MANCGQNRAALRHSRASVSAKPGDVATTARPAFTKVRRSRSKVSESARPRRERNVQVQHTRINVHHVASQE